MKYCSANVSGKVLNEFFHKHKKHVSKHRKGVPAVAQWWREAYIQIHYGSLLSLFWFEIHCVFAGDPADLLQTIEWPLGYPMGAEININLQGHISSSCSIFWRATALDTFRIEGPCRTLGFYFWMFGMLHGVSKLENSLGPCGFYLSNIARIYSRDDSG